MAFLFLYSLYIFRVYIDTISINDKAKEFYFLLKEFVFGGLGIEFNIIELLIYLLEVFSIFLLSLGEY